MTQYDLAIVGGGILGLAHALAAQRAGKSVIVLERHSQCIGASIRNFGFVTVTGQARDKIWPHAKRSREIWAEIAPKAGIGVAHRGAVIAAQRPEAEALIEAFLDTDMAEGCTRITPDQAHEKIPALDPHAIRAALYSPHELRVESREAIPALARYLEGLGVVFRYNCAVQAVDTPQIETSQGPIKASQVVVCPGDDATSLFAERLQPRQIEICKLHMLRLRPKTSFRMEAALLSDLSMIRYHGFADLPEAAALQSALAQTQPVQLANGVHLIVVQSGDGSLVVGDSHHYGASADPFQPAAIDKLITDEFDALMSCDYEIAERWTGTYASAPGSVYFIDAPDPATRVVMVTSGCGASTAFSIAEETLAGLG